MIVLLLFALVQGLSWLVEEQMPSLASTSLSQAVGAILAGVGLLIWQPAPSSVSNTKGDLKSFLKAALATAVWISGSAWTFKGFNYHPGANARTLSMALIPVITGFLTYIKEESAGADLSMRLWPAMAGLSGLLLLISKPDPGSWRGWAALVAAPLITGAAAAAIPRARRSDTNATTSSYTRLPRLAKPLGVVAAGLLLSVYQTAVVSERSWHLGSVLLQGLGTSISLWLLLRLGAARWSSLFFLAPLVALLGSILLIRPRLDLRAIAGLLMLAVGGFCTLIREGKPDAEALHIYNATF